MPQRIFQRLQQSILGGAIIIGSASILSRLLGLVRDRLLSTTFGAGEVLDSYFTAFKVPDFIFNILVLGVLSASFVPVFIDYKIKKNEEEAMHIANTLLNMLMIGLVILGAACYFAAPQLVQWLSYGDTQVQQAQTVQFMRPMLIALFFFGMSNVLSGLLHAYKKFIIYSLAPIMYNVGIIIGILFLVPAFGSIGLPYGVVLGSALHMLVQIPSILKIGFRYSPIFSPIVEWKHQGVRKILALMPPRAFALGLTQFNMLILFAIASTLDAGARSVWQFADNMQHFPINIFGVSLALAAFPVFSEAFAENNIERFKKVFSENFRRILFFIIPISIATLLLRAQLVRIVYGAGAFDWNDTIQTADVLGVFALSMFAQALIPLLARSFFAKQDTKTPVVISAVAMALNIVLAIALVTPYGVMGLALSFSIGAIVQMLILLATLRVRHGDLDDDLIIASTWRIVICSLGMGVIIQGMKYLMVQYVDMHTFVGIFTQTVSALGAGAVVYLLLSLQFDFEEARMIRTKVFSMWGLVKRLRK